MRILMLVLAAACVSTGCDADLPTAPAATPGERSRVVDVAVTTPIPGVIACRGRIDPVDPLFVVDGRIVVPDIARALTPEDVESIEVVKSTAASAVYGSRASRGVVLITTRRARSRTAR